MKKISIKEQTQIVGGTWKATCDKCDFKAYAYIGVNEIYNTIYKHHKKYTTHTVSIKKLY